MERQRPAAPAERHHLAGDARVRPRARSAGQAAATAAARRTAPQGHLARRVAQVKGAFAVAAPIWKKLQTRRRTTAAAGGRFSRPPRRTRA
jgi:hypothetical protein